MKIPLPVQIAEAERHRNSLQTLRDEGFEYPEAPSLQDRLDIQEGICLTLAFNKTYEKEFRQFMAMRSKETA